MVVVVGCHLGLLIAMLQPATYHRETPAVVKNEALALQLRFISPPQPTTSQQSLPSPPPVISPPDNHRALAELRRASQPAPVTHIVPLPAETDSTSEATTSPQAVAPAASTTLGQPANSEASIDDGGFQERLRNAEHSHTVHGVPGSDRRVAPGMQLTDPMHQGIGAVMRNAQRLFGVTNRHCIDVEVWQHLTPDELSARHISPSDVNKINEKYDCNRPMGLSF